MLLLIQNFKDSVLRSPMKRVYDVFQMLHSHKANLKAGGPVHPATGAIPPVRYTRNALLESTRLRRTSAQQADTQHACAPRRQKIHTASPRRNNSSLHPNLCWQARNRSGSGLPGNLPRATDRLGQDESRQRRVYLRPSTGRCNAKVIPSRVGIAAAPSLRQRPSNGRSCTKSSPWRR